MMRKISVIGLCSAVFLMMLGVGMIVAVLPQRIIDMTGSVSAVGYLTAIFAIPYMLVQIPSGVFSDKLGYKFFLIWGYLLCGLAGLFYYASGGAASVFLGRFFQGMGESPIWALAPALLSRHYPSEKGKAMGMYTASLHAGLTIGPVLGIVLSQRWQGEESFLFYAIVCFLGGVIVLLMVNDPETSVRTTPQRIRFKDLFALLSQRERLVVLSGIMLYGAGYAIFLTYIPAFLISTKGGGHTVIGGVFALFYIAVSVSQFLTGFLSDRMGRSLFMIRGLSMAAGSLALFPGCNSLWMGLWLFLASLGFGGFSLASLAWLNESVSDALKGAISGAYYLFWGVGYFSGPLLISHVGKSTSFHTSFYLFSSVLVVQTLLLVVCFKNPASCQRQYGMGME